MVPADSPHRTNRAIPIQLPRSSNTQGHSSDASCDDDTSRGKSARSNRVVAQHVGPARREGGMRGNLDQPLRLGRLPRCPHRLPHGHPGLVPIGQADLAANRPLPLLEHAQVPAAPVCLEESLDDRGPAGCQRHLVAGIAWLTDLEDRRTPFPDVANADGCLVDSGNSQVLAEGAGADRALQLDLRRPPRIVVCAVRVNRLVRATMRAQIGLAVADDVCRPDLDIREFHWSFPEATQDGSTAPESDHFRHPHIDRLQGDHAVTPANSLTARTSSTSSSSVWKIGTEWFSWRWRRYRSISAARMPVASAPATSERG